MTQSMESAAMEARNHSALCSQRSGRVIVRGSASTTCRGSCALAPTRTISFWVAPRPPNCQPDAKFADARVRLTACSMLPQHTIPTRARSWERTPSLRLARFVSSTFKDCGLSSVADDWYLAMLPVFTIALRYATTQSCNVGQPRPQRLVVHASAPHHPAFSPGHDRNIAWYVTEVRPPNAWRRDRGGRIGRGRTALVGRWPSSKRLMTAAGLRGREHATQVTITGSWL
jgi:hypothetical protein